MAAPRLRIQLGVAHDGPTKFWWQPSPAAQTVFDVLEELSAHLGLAVGAAAGLVATMDGFAVLPGSRTDLLRDGDLLVIGSSPGRKRSAEAAAAGQVQQQAKRLKGSAAALVGHAALPAPAAAPCPGDAAGGGDSSKDGSSSSSSSSSEEDDSSSDSEDESSSEAAEEESSSEEASSSSEDEGESSGGQAQKAGSKDAGDLGTPAAVAPALNGSAAKQPSRSARRKAAKRRLRRLGVLPPKATVQAGPGRAAAAAAAEQAKPAGKPRGKLVAALPQQAAATQQHEVVGQEGRQPAVQPTGAGAPEVTVPSDWQKQWGEPDERQQRAQQKRERRGKERQALEQAVQAVQAVRLPPQQPMSEAAFGQLVPLAGLPSVGAVLAYRLLEVGPELQPGVSEVRCGRVSGVDAATQEVTLTPHPDPSVHPLAYQRFQRAAQRQAGAAGDTAEEEPDEDEGELGNLYSEGGTLTAQLSAFVELRLLELAPGVDVGAPPQQGGHAPAAAAAPGNGGSGQPVAATPQQPDDLGPSSYSQLGPPKPAAARGDVIAPEGGWASLYRQLQQRRSQLAAQQAGAGAAAGEAGGTPCHAPPPRPDAASPAEQVRSAPPAAGGSRTRGGSGGRASSLTPGATRPRAGVRRTALGPMLRMLREAEQLQG